MTCGLGCGSLALRSNRSLQFQRSFKNKQAGIQKVVTCKVQNNDDNGLGQSFQQPTYTAVAISNKSKVADQTIDDIQQQKIKEQTGLMRLWSDLPAERKVVLSTFAAFVICNMDKVNISIAIIPMSKQFGWGPAISGLIQSGFFIGYLLSQLPGGFLCSAKGGRRMMPNGMMLMSIATAATPWAANQIPTLLAARAAVGSGESIAPSAAVSMVSSTLPKNERSGAIALIFGGLNIGTMVGLLVGPVAIKAFGWQSLFVLFGGVGIAWVVLWERIVSSLKVTDPLVHQQLTNSGVQSADTSSSADMSLSSVPFRGFLRSRPLWSTLYAHCAHNYLQYNILAWLPTYFIDVQHQDLLHASYLALLPPAAGFIMSIVAGRSADTLIQNNVRITTVRKLAQFVSFGISSACLLALPSIEPGDAVASTALITAALAVSNFSYAGLYCSHQDMSPKYASLMLGWTNTWASLPGILGIELTGVILEKTHSWDLALFYPSTFFLLSSLIVYIIGASSEPQDFDGLHKRPFGWESGAKQLMQSTGLDRFFSKSSKTG